MEKRVKRTVPLTPGLGVVTYGYDTYGKLETITRGNTVYTLVYDSIWNRPVQTKVGSVALSTNTYDDDFRLETVTYANGFSARYEYDDLDRVSKIYQTEGNNDEELTYEMIYNGEGDLYEIRNYRTGRASFFDYDHAGRCMASKERVFTVTNGVVSYGAILSSYGYRYDECNNLTKLTCSALGSSWSTVYTYDNDNRPSTTTLASGKVITNTYDAIGRLQKRTLGLASDYDTTLTYVPGNDTNKTTALVATYRNGSDAAYNYTYDDVGNITEITQGTTSIGYVYDDANRLIRENNQVTNQTIVYDYENELWGNIQSRTIYAYTTAENPGTPIAPVVTYTYDTSANGWGDQLVEYNGQTITYDDMGNPTTYRGYTMAWRGKQLVSASNGTNSLTFEYNEDGLRQKKVCNNVVTDYFYNGSVLIGMQRGQSKFLFSYDAGGNVISVRYITANDTNEYYYLRNAQGDIVKLIDANGVSVVEYTYDTWGKKVTTTGSLAGTLGLFQPFRYRGYVYDWETGFYYLQSRYYDPTTGRFISADVLLSTGQGVLGHNCYAYCLDNPVNMRDQSGNVPSHCVDETDSGVNSNPTPNSEPDDILSRAAKLACYFLLMNPIVPYFSEGQEIEALETFKKGYTIIYRGAIVIPNYISDSSFTLPGIIFLHESQLEPDTLRHEYGHIIQAEILGPAKYLEYIAKPSMAHYKDRISPSEYCSQPWEITAEIFGGNYAIKGADYYLSGAAEAGLLYLLSAMR